jgi:hypothetical protein
MTPFARQQRRTAFAALVALSALAVILVLAILLDRGSLPVFGWEKMPLGGARHENRICVRRAHVSPGI